MTNYKDAIKNTIATSFNVKDEYKNKTMNDLAFIMEQSRLPYSVCALNIEGDLNIGMMARSAHLLGAREFFIFGRRKVDSRSFVGADKYFPVTKVDGLINNELSLDLFNKLMINNNLLPVFIEHDGWLMNDVVWKKIDDEINISKKQICFVFGNEGSGIPLHFMTDNNRIISVPQLGVLRSYNVAATASIVMFDYVRYKEWIK